MNRTDQAVFAKRINIRQMGSAMKIAKALGKTAFFMGGAGLGKSKKMQQIADEMFPHRIGNNLCDIRLSDKEPQDVAGIPIPVELADGTTRTVYAVPEFWPTDPDWEGIVFLDELPNATLSTQHSAYQVVLDHVAGQHKFPKGCVFAGAGNRDTDNAGTTEMSGPLVNRMVIFEIDYDLDIWIEDFAVPYDVHPYVIGFLKQNPDYFYTGDVEDRPSPVFASPRQWEFVSELLKMHDKGKIVDHLGNPDEYLLECAIQGTVGPGLETMVLSYYLRAKKLPPLEDIFTGKVTEHKLERSDIDLLYVLTQSGLSQIAKDIMDDRKYSDEEVVERAGRFLSFIYSNHGAEHKDTVISMVLNLFRAPPGRDPILTANTRRGPIAMMMRKKAVAVMAVIHEYLDRYSDLNEQL